MQRGDQKNPQTNYRKQFMSTKEQQNRAIPANSSISIYDNGEMRHIQTKSSIWIHSLSNQFCNRNAIFSVKLNYEETSTQNLIHKWKNSIQIPIQLYSLGHWRKREVYPFSFIYVWTTIEHQVYDWCASVKIDFFSNHRSSEKQFRQQQGHHGAGTLMVPIMLFRYELLW